MDLIIAMSASAFLRPLIVISKIFYASEIISRIWFLAIAIENVLGVATCHPGAVLVLGIAFVWFRGLGIVSSVSVSTGRVSGVALGLGNIGC